MKMYEERRKELLNKYGKGNVIFVALHYVEGNIRDLEYMIKDETTNYGGHILHFIRVKM